MTSLQRKLGEREGRKKTSIKEREKKWGIIYRKLWTVTNFEAPQESVMCDGL